MRLPVGAVLIALLAGLGQAHAEPLRIETPAFVFKDAHYNYPIGDAELLSYQDGKARIALTGLQDVLSKSPLSAATGPVWQYNIDRWESESLLTAQQGYQITGMTISGTWHGVHQLGEGGYIDSAIRILWQVGEAPFAGQFANSGGTGAYSLNGEQSFSATFGLDARTTPLTRLELYLDSIAVQEAYGGVVVDPISGQITHTTTFSDVSVSDLILTIETAPLAEVPEVPEPGTWMMLLGGLGGIYLMRRRRPA
ncbi:PEP-CTERM sorting domain-containing protein [Duganella sp. HH105]|uniref:PEP-CTERM sorting domain-containing protein n=1 Tax=Duganella sp. HH105 TaxID=1781067 RepID=UPI000877D393|nr:PEP-CTERM sorting domain-containing protein [Duganella sp. HH105]OEZ61966.1 PEP-CTERM motif protein [Duganella sp. HH105]